MWMYAITRTYICTHMHTSWKEVASSLSFVPSNYVLYICGGYNNTTPFGLARDAIRSLLQSHFTIFQMYVFAWPHSAPYFSIVPRAVVGSTAAMYSENHAYIGYDLTRDTYTHTLTIGYSFFNLLIYIIYTHPIPPRLQIIVAFGTAIYIKPLNLRSNIFFVASCAAFRSLARAQRHQ